jgi:HK97 family phage major capsid protein
MDVLAAPRQRMRAAEKAVRDTMVASEKSPGDDSLEQAWRTAIAERNQAIDAFDRAEAVEEARKNLPVSPGGGLLDSGYVTDPARVKRGWDPETQRVGGEESVYHMGGQYSWLMDQRAAAKGDGQALERIVRAFREIEDAGRATWRIRERTEVVTERAVTEEAGHGGELVPPLYLQEEYLKLARAARPYVDQIPKRPLPPNANSINIPRLFGGTATEAQKDLATVEEKQLTTALLTFPVITIASMQSFARQLFDRAVPKLAHMVVFPDLVAAYLTNTDTECLEGSGSAPHAKGVLETVGSEEKITWTAASPELSELYKKIANGIQKIYTTRYLPPTAIFMHPRRWAWILTQLDSNKRPLVVPRPYGPFDTMGLSEVNAAEGMVGTVLGLPVFIDPSIPTGAGASTNQDKVIIQRTEDSGLWRTSQ